MSSIDDTVIKVDGVYKDFVLPHEKNSSIKSAVVNAFKQKNNSSEIQHALKNISFEVKRGEFFGIVGRNGSGKSTLLKILAEIYQPTKGTVQYSGKLVPFIELGVGFNPELTGRENVFLNGALLGFTRKEIESLYDNIVEFAELGRFMDQKLKNYSSGMQVRLAFSMAIQANADILLIDEVLAVGDAAFQRKCLEYFQKLKKEKCTVVFVSHDMDSVRQFCDRAILIEKNRIIEEGNTEKVAEEYTRLFLEKRTGTAENSDAPQKRWGSGAVSLEKLYITDHTVTDETDAIEFGGEIIIHHPTQKPIIGFRITDGAGKMITGTNSMLLKVSTGSYDANSSIKFKWNLPNIFSNGDYNITLSVIEENNNTLDHIPEAIKFKVNKLVKTPYIVSPHINLEIHNGEKDK